MSAAFSAAPVFVMGRRAVMRTSSFIVGIFTLALAVAGIAEWASRWAVTPKTGATTELRTSASNEAAVKHTETQIKPPGVEAAPGNASDKGFDGMKVLLVLGGGATKFRANGQSLSEQMIGEIDQIFTGPDAADLICGQFVIEGHTDNLGSPEVNKQIGLS